MGSDTKFDAVAFGSGLSGLTAALTLAEGGAKVAVFEKQPVMGGASVNFRRDVCRRKLDAV